MKLSPINFINFKQNRNNFRSRAQVLSFQAKKDSFEKSQKPTIQEANSALKTLAMFFGLDIDALTPDKFGVVLNKTNPNLDKYTTNYNGVMLLNSKNIANKNKEKYEKAIERVKNVGFEKLSNRKALKPIESESPVLWSLTSEFEPIKEGGLGVVPPAIAKNAKKIGVDIPSFVPMYLQEGIATLKKRDNDYTYSYKGNEFDLKKAISFKMDIFQNGEVKSLPVEIFVNENKDNNLVFVKCSNCFDGAIYEANSKVQEPEKFVIFSKAIYELAKFKVDGDSALKDLEIHSSSALNLIQEPDGMILNDWQASPYAPLARYKAPMENACGMLSDEACEKLSNMNIITIGHNVQYQGLIYDNNDIQRKNNNNNILNTLFDKFAYDIVSNANSGSENFGLKTKKEAKNIDNVLLLKAQNEQENYVNLLNMGIILSDYFCPVSQNYANELIQPKHKNLSYDLQNALIQKAKAGKIKGIINGNDFENLSIVAKKGIIKKQTGLDFKTYTKESSADEVLNARMRNKINLYKNFILPFAKSPDCQKEQIANVANLTKRLEFVQNKGDVQPPNLRVDELLDIPVLMSGGRLVSQKGVDVLCDSLKVLFENWEKDFPGCAKPIVYIAGSDGEGGRHREYIEKFKSSLGKDSSRIIFAHGYAPLPSLMAGSDFFLMTSNFEPCGLTQSEALAFGTPVIATSVGGLVDTINRNGKTNGILTKINSKKPIVEEYYNSLKKGLNIYFNDKQQYSNMVQDALAEDFSWIQQDKQGPVYEYMELIGAETK